MSQKFEKVKEYYDKGLWTKSMVANAVAKEWITAEEYELIVGEPYAPIDPEATTRDYVNELERLGV